MSTWFLLIGSVAYSQTWDEWMNQKETQRRYLVEQIAALRVYGDYIGKGYSIVKNGMRTIGDIKSGDFCLHHLYFRSLQNVSPAVRDYPRTRELLQLQQQTEKMIAQCKSYIVRSDGYAPAEKQYQYRVLARLKEDCLQTKTEFESVTTNGAMEMKDDERIRRIDRLHERSIQQWVFIRQWFAEAITLDQSRTQGQRDIDNSKRLHGLK
jgi:hypothetical protein